MVPAGADDAAFVATNLRLADYEEAWVFYGRNPVVMAVESFEASDMVWTAFYDDTPVALFGRTKDGATGVPWLIGTPELEHHGMALARLSRPYLERMKEGCTHLTNWVDSRNALSIKWLQWLGFKMAPATPEGPFGIPFHQFWMPV